MHAEESIRLSFFCGTFLLVALWERLAPCRQLCDSKGRRWRINLSLVAINAVVPRFLVPILPASMAVMAHVNGWGLLNNMSLPGWVKVAAALIFLDLIIYLQHLVFHYQPLLWRLHRVHHTDLDIDVTTGNRFHPLEIIISLLIKLAAVAICGAPATAVIIFETILNAAAQFNHGNIRIQPQIDRWLRLVIVTPDMHRVHHSVIVRETNSNFGFNIPVWDRLFGTYRAQPQDGHPGMTIGLREFRATTALSFVALLVLPFKKK